MRKKPMQNGGGYNNQRQKPRYAQGGGGGDYRPQGGHNSNGGRPRRNYGAAREQYLQKARDALASGDRVLAENYLQHADHCYRMMVEEGARHYTPPPQNQQQPQDGQPQEGQPHDGQQHDMQQEDAIPQNTSQLPAFLTGGHEQQQSQQAAASEAPPAQNWEERDADA